MRSACTVSRSIRASDIGNSMYGEIDAQIIGAKVLYTNTSTVVPMKLLYIYFSIVHVQTLY